jgi:hypothetical protein
MTSRQDLSLAAHLLSRTSAAALMLLRLLLAQSSQRSMISCTS